MKLLIVIFFVAAVGLIAAATGISRSHSGSTIGRARTASTSILQDMQTARAARLSAEDFDDRSLVFPRQSER